MANNEIIVRKVAEGKFTITADGSTRHGFASTQDAAEWAGCMQEHGLFKGYSLILVSLTGARRVLQPTYNHPCHVPGICS